MLAAEVLLAAGAQKVYPPLKKVGPISSTGELKRELEGATSKMFKLSAYHPMSTARMGKDSDVGVVDEKGLVYGYENLYIANASVIPSTTIVNPQLTINALSLMVAQGIS